MGMLLRRHYKEARTGPEGEPAKMASTGEATTTTTATLTPGADILALSVKDAKPAIGAMTEVDALEALADAEADGQDRVGIHKAISARITALESEG